MFKFAKNCSGVGLVLHRITNKVIKPDIRTFTKSPEWYSNVRKVNHDNLKTDNSSIIHYEKTNMPVEMENPYQKEKQFCILCKHKILPDYRNVRLLSQFVSRFTGRMYGRHITGLCKAQQERLEKEIQKSHKAGLMPSYFRDPRFSHDPLLFDPDHPFRPHRY